MEVGRRIYYDIATGNVILDTGERRGAVVPTTIEHDIVVYYVLHSRTRESFNYIELEYGQYAQDFAECNGYRVNPETRTIEFSYPDPSDPEPQERAYQIPLSEQIKTLESAVMELTFLVAAGGAGNV